MSISLVEIAERAMNEYYQDYAPHDAFFDKSDFMFHVANYYNQFLNDQFQRQRREVRAEEGFANVEVPVSWTVRENIEVKQDEGTGEFYAETSQDIFTFMWDSFAYGIVRIKQGKVKDCDYQPKNEFVRVTVDEANEINLLPITNKCFYFADGKRRINTLNKNPVSIDIWYVPMVDPKIDSDVMSDVLAAQCITAVLTLKFGTKKEVTIDMTNDQNPNTVIGQQIDPKVTQVQSQQ